MGRGSVTDHEYQKLGPTDTLVVKFGRRMDSRDVREWLEQFEVAYPDRRAVVVDHQSEIRIEARSASTTNRLLVAAIAVLVIDVLTRAVL
jgi:hypothetical protein